MARPSLPTSLPGRLFVALLAWFVIVLAGWGFRPLTDNVPVRCVDPAASAEAERTTDPTSESEAGSEATDNAADDDRRPRHLRDEGDDAPGCDEDELASVTASCHSPVSRDESLRGEAPTPDPGWELERAPCRIPVRSAAQLMAVNSVVVVLAGAGVAVWSVRRRSAPDVSTEA